MLKPSTIDFTVEGRERFLDILGEIQIERFCPLNTEVINIAPKPFFPLFRKRKDVFSVKEEKITRLGSLLKDVAMEFKGYGF